MRFTTLLALSSALVLVQPLMAAPTDSLETEFLNPPDSAKPQTWWHWMNGNITKEGLAADLKAMKQIGLGGATIVNVDCEIPAGPVKFMSPEWRDDFKFAVQEANRQGLKLCVENCAGWSSSGGPWNTVTNAMKRLTSAETNVHGPIYFNAILPQPQTTLGYYRDIGVLAFKASGDQTNVLPSEALFAGTLKIEQAVYEAKDGGGSANVFSNIMACIQRGEKSVVIDNDTMGGDAAPGQVKQLRLKFTLGGKPDMLLVDENETLLFPVNARQLAAAKLLQKTPVDQTFVKPSRISGTALGVNIPQKQIIDLSDKLSTDGHLKWKVPAGDWVILRLGYAPIGINNHPAPKEGEGLECDKLSKSALDWHWNGFMQKILDDVGPLTGTTLDASLIDSYEIGNQDWTPDFRKEFKKRRGYDPLKYLVTYTHRVIDSPEISQRFMWDMRRTVADLFADNYYTHFTELCHEHGLTSDIEPYTGPFESMQSGKSSDLVMGEFWTGSQGDPSVKLASSIAHIYGKSIVGAESFTASAEADHWQNDPYALKTLGDLMFCEGINRYIFHRYAMQPWTNRWPGMTMGEFGFHFDRTLTWWQQGKAWIDYISRCQFLLQQGRTIADVAYFTGEDAPKEMVQPNPALPTGYDYDAVNADVLMHGATVKNGRLTLASGASYAVLVLPAKETRMTPQLLDCIARLIHDGATVMGPRPKHSPSLADYPACDVKVKEIAAKVWGNCDGHTVLENRYGHGEILWDRPLASVFKEQNLLPDFETVSSDGNVDLKYTHRHADDLDIYFISNQNRNFGSAECAFRVDGKVPEIWHPDTGRIEPALVWSAQDGRTKVLLNFDPAGSVFVVFRQADNGANHLVSAEGDMAPQSANHQKLEIQQAIYMGANGAGKTNVTDKLAALVHDNQLIASVNNDVFGTDPATFTPKQLRVDYRFNGQLYHETVSEGDKIILPPSPSWGQPSAWDVKLAGNGTPQIEAWDNGHLKWTTSSGLHGDQDITDVSAPQKITGPWTIIFPPDWGAPPSIILNDLISWTEDTNAGVRYFSGTAAYEKEIEIPADDLQSGQELWLDLGKVKNFAEIWVNGQDLGVLWKPPFRVNISSAAKAGNNKLVVKVTNLWPNRLIGDEQLPPDCEWDGSRLKEWPQWLLEGKPSPTGRLTFATWRYFKKDSPLLESGLIGPVTLQTVKLIPISIASTTQ